MKTKKAICKILTVDDEPGVDAFFYEFFTMRNFEVLSASSGKEAVKIAKKEHPRMVLMDIKMRGMDGIEALKQIKEIDKNIVVIMVTGVKDDETAKKASFLGADAYITKPLSLEYLEKVVLVKFLDREVENVKKHVDKPT